VSGSEVCEDQVSNDGDGGLDESSVKTLDEKIRHQM